MPINVAKLTWELQNAEIPIEGCSEDGRIDFLPEATQIQKDQAQTILTNHNPVWYIEERQKEYPPISEQLDMVYNDMLNNTNTWMDTLAAIKARWPAE